MLSCPFVCWKKPESRLFYSYPLSTCIKYRDLLVKQIDCFHLMNINNIFNILKKSMPNVFINKYWFILMDSQQGRLYVKGRLGTNEGLQFRKHTKMTISIKRLSVPLYLVRIMKFLNNLIIIYVADFFICTSIDIMFIKNKSVCMSRSSIELLTVTSLV